jgi:hypothetical protein
VRYLLVYLPKFGARTQSPGWLPRSNDRVVRRMSLERSCVVTVGGSTQGAGVSTIHMKKSMTVTPEQFIASLTDFGPGRSELFANSADDHLKVYDKSPGHADVLEGNDSSWERLEYDWTDPRHVTMKTVDSNLWGGKSGHTYTLTPQPDGTTELDAVVVRDGKNFKGKVIGALLSVAGKQVIGHPLDDTIKAIEARNGEASTKQM